MYLYMYISSTKKTLHSNGWSCKQVAALPVQQVLMTVMEIVVRDLTVADVSVQHIHVP